MNKNFLFVVFMVVVSFVLSACEASPSLWGKRAPVVHVEPVNEFDIETIEIEPVFTVQASQDAFSEERQLIAEYNVYSSEKEFFLARLIFELSVECQESNESLCIRFYDSLDDFQVVVDGHECSVDELGFDRFVAFCNMTVAVDHQPSEIQVFSRVFSVASEPLRGELAISSVSAFESENNTDVVAAPIWNPSIGDQSGQTSAIIQLFHGFGINWRRTEVVVEPVPVYPAFDIELVPEMRTSLNFHDGGLTYSSYGNFPNQLLAEYVVTTVTEPITISSLVISVDPDIEGSPVLFNGITSIWLEIDGQRVDGVRVTLDVFQFDFSQTVAPDQPLHVFVRGDLAASESVQGVLIVGWMDVEPLDTGFYPAFNPFLGIDDGSSLFRGAVGTGLPHLHHRYIGIYMDCCDQ